MPSRTSSGPSGRSSGCSPRGIVAWKPAAMIGVTIMKMMSSTSITSISGVTLMSALTAADARALVTDRATGLLRLLRLEFLGEDRSAELGADALDQVVDQLLGRVGHLDRQEVDLGREEVVEPHGRDCHDQAERRGDERLGDTGRHRRERPAADRKSTRLNSSHSQISYAVFCLKKKKKKNSNTIPIEHTITSLQNTPPRNC